MKNKSQVFIWALYDFANSTYAVIIVAFVFAVFFVDIVCERSSIGDFYWSLGINISMVISAVLNPICGAIADRYSQKKSFLFLFTLLAVIPTMLMFFSGRGMVLYALILFIISNIGFQTSLTFYDAFISDIVEEKYYNKVSSFGYAFGYLGSLMSLALVFPLSANPQLLFLLTGVLFALFAAPLFIWLREKKVNISTTQASLFENIIFGVKKVWTTVKNISKYANLRNYLIAYFFYIDAVNTIIFFSGIYARKTLEFQMVELALFFVLVQITAMIGAFIFAYLGDRLGILKSIYLNVVSWLIIILIIFFIVDKDTFLIIWGYKVHYFFVIGGLAGTFLGSIQSLSRALMTKLTPLESKTEFFGFYSLFDKTSTLLGPLTFGLVSWLSGSQKLAVLSVGTFFIFGLLILLKVKETN
ncbi:MAG: MFS transporter [Ignavibacteria bacterium]